MTYKYIVRGGLQIQELLLLLLTITTVYPLMSALPYSHAFHGAGPSLQSSEYMFVTLVFLKD